MIHDGRSFVVNILSLPFNARVGITLSTQDDCLQALDSGRCHENHLRTIHSSALFAEAEATSGEFLNRSRGERTDVGGVVRRSAAKYLRPATGVVSSRVKTEREVIVEAIATVDTRGKALVEINIEIFDQEGKQVGSFGFTWLIALETFKNGGS